MQCSSFCGIFNSCAMFEGGSRLGYLELLDIELLKSLAEHLQDREMGKGVGLLGFFGVLTVWSISSMRLYKSLWGRLLFFPRFLFVGYHYSQSPHHLPDDRGTERGLAFAFLVINYSGFASISVVRPCKSSRGRLLFRLAFVCRIISHEALEHCYPIMRLKRAMSIGVNRVAFISRWMDDPSVRYLPKILQASNPHSLTSHIIAPSHTSAIHPTHPPKHDQTPFPHLEPLPS